jgi:C-terminal processing protease CtpA/Prc
LERVFSNLKKDSAKGLIIDSRNNYGGNNSFGDDPLEYITSAKNIEIGFSK